MVHRLVAEAFHADSRAPGLIVCHGDGDKTNNFASNLRWDTYLANSKDNLHQPGDHKIKRTHCPQGHAYDVENTYISKLGQRHCKKCRANRGMEWRANHKIAA